MSRKILVTGGAGFVGSHLVGALLAAGHEVRVVDRRTRGANPTSWIQAASELERRGLAS